MEEQCEEFKAVLTNQDNVKELVDTIGIFDLTPLLIKQKGMDKGEVDEIKALNRTNKERLQQIIKKMVEKNEYTRYIALSQVIQYKNNCIWERLFPFAKQLDHQKLVVRRNHPPPISPVMSPSSPYILWLCADEETFMLATNIWSVPSAQPIRTTPSGTFKYYELPCDDVPEFNVWLFCPSDGLSGIKIQKLLQFYRETKYCIFTGSSTPQNTPLVQDNDICVVKRERTCSAGFIAELCHMTTFWQIEDKSPWECSKEVIKVKFGTVGSGTVGSGTVGSGTVGSTIDSSSSTADVVSSDALMFCETSEEQWKKGITVHHAAILAVTRDKFTQCCKEKPLHHSVQYTHSVIKYLIRKHTLLHEQ